MKFLLWAVVVGAVVMWLVRASAQRAKKNAPRAAPDALAEPMRKCAHCGVHVPASEALLDSAGVVFCSEQHRLLQRSD